MVIKINKPTVNRKFRKLSRLDRITALKESALISEAEAEVFRAGLNTLSCEQAEHMVENVIGVFGLPEGIAINFPLNGKQYAVPMVVEEPSVVAALSYAALLAEKGGGFKANADAPLIYGQIQLIDIEDLPAAIMSIDQHREHLLDLANSHMPSMLARGGGAKDLRVRELVGPATKQSMLIVDIAIDTCDAMGANLVNSVCEALAPEIEALVQGRALLKILSNLADQALARAEVRFSPEQLTVKASRGSQGFSGEEMCERIALANDFALADPYRAATHNKGIFNGIDAVAIATGNDWRSIEAAAHAYAARSGQYRALTSWWVDDDQHLCGRIELPMKVGTVGGSLQSNPAVALNQSLLGLSGARELASILAAVGLAQNFAALRALVGVGIQKGHMTLHARSVALSAGAPSDLFDQVVKRLVDDGQIKVWRALEIIKELSGE